MEPQKVSGLLIQIADDIKVAPFASFSKSPTIAPHIICEEPRNTIGRNREIHDLKSKKYL